MTAQALAQTAEGARGPLSVRAVLGREALALLDARWDALVLEQPLPNPTLLSTWLREMAALEPGEPLVVVAETGGRLVGGGAFGLRRVGGARVAVWIGTEGLRRMVRPILTPDLLVAADVPEAAAAVVDGAFDVAHALFLGPTPLEGPMARGLAQRAPWHARGPAVDGWVTRLPPSRIEARQAEAAYEVRRARARGAEIGIAVRREPAEVAEAMERLIDLHRAHWGPRPDDRARFSSTGEERDWHRRAVLAMAERGAVLLAAVLEDGETVASDLCFVAGRGALFHTCAMRRGGVLRSAGHVCLLAVTAAAAEVGAEAVDLGRGSLERGGPKSDLAPERLPFVRFAAASSAPGQRVLGGVDTFQTYARAAVRLGRRALRAARP